MVNCSLLIVCSGHFSASLSLENRRGVFARYLEDYFENLAL